MAYTIFDDGNMVDSFDEETSAVAALDDLASEPEAAARLVLVAFDANGDPVADCVPGERLVIPG